MVYTTSRRWKMPPSREQARLHERLAKAESRRRSNELAARKIELEGEIEQLEKLIETSFNFGSILKFLMFAWASVAINVREFDEQLATAILGLVISASTLFVFWKANNAAQDNNLQRRNRLAVLTRDLATLERETARHEQ